MDFAVDISSVCVCVCVCVYIYIYIILFHDTEWAMFILSPKANDLKANDSLPVYVYRMNHSTNVAATGCDIPIVLIERSQGRRRERESGVCHRKLYK